MIDLTVICAQCSAAMRICEACAARGVYPFRCVNSHLRPVPMVPETVCMCRPCRRRLERAVGPLRLATTRVADALRKQMYRDRRRSQMQ